MSIYGQIGSTPRESLVKETSQGIITSTNRSMLISDTPTAQSGALVREILGKPLTGNLLQFTSTVRETLVSGPLPSGLTPFAPIPVFPTLPYGFPLKVTPYLKTTVGTVKSGREVRYAQQVAALWEIELLFEELRDQTQNQTPYSPLSGFMQYETLCAQWLMMYGQTGVFYFDAPWDDSRSEVSIGTGDGSTYEFTFYRTFGIGSAYLTEPVGGINTIFDLKVNGVIVPSSNYMIERNKVIFQDAKGNIYPPPASASITSSFSFYYLCRFESDEQEFQEFMKNRWEVKNMKFRSVYWI